MLGTVGRVDSHLERHVIARRPTEPFWIYATVNNGIWDHTCFLSTFRIKTCATVPEAQDG